MATLRDFSFVPPPRVTPTGDLASGNAADPGSAQVDPGLVHIEPDPRGQRRFPGQVGPTGLPMESGWWGADIDFLTTVSVETHDFQLAVPESLRRARLRWYVLGVVFDHDDTTDALALQSLTMTGTPFELLADIDVRLTHRHAHFPMFRVLEDAFNFKGQLIGQFEDATVDDLHVAFHLAWEPY